MPTGIEEVIAIATGAVFIGGAVYAVGKGVYEIVNSARKANYKLFKLCRVLSKNELYEDLQKNAEDLDVKFKDVVSLGSTPLAIVKAMRLPNNRWKTLKVWAKWKVRNFNLWRKVIGMPVAKKIVKGTAEAAEGVLQAYERAGQVAKLGVKGAKVAKDMFGLAGDIDIKSAGFISEKNLQKLQDAHIAVKGFLKEHKEAILEFSKDTDDSTDDDDEKEQSLDLAKKAALLMKKVNAVGVTGIDLSALTYGAKLKLLMLQEQELLHKQEGSLDDVADEQNATKLTSAQVDQNISLLLKNAKILDMESKKQPRGMQVLTCDVGEGEENFLLATRSDYKVYKASIAMLEIIKKLKKGGVISLSEKAKKELVGGIYPRLQRVNKLVDVKLKKQQEQIAILENGSYKKFVGYVCTMFPSYFKPNPGEKTFLEKIKIINEHKSSIEKAIERMHANGQLSTKLIEEHFIEPNTPETDIDSQVVEYKTQILTRLNKLQEIPALYDKCKELEEEAKKFVAIKTAVEVGAKSLQINLHQSNHATHDDKEVNRKKRKVDKTLMRKNAMLYGLSARKQVQPKYFNHLPHKHHLKRPRPKKPSGHL